VSKNVAVFVDVANIFYAAKAAGVDIDYVTLLKASSAGRDLVRAYAYTGLDPENENQRNFHDFLRRHGYKVVSKDIRKYGDGKVKANLDIELVVDMMKTARNLDIAIVVSGDGDFAPAIRAVQEMGVRVEVVSFRGNTSSDLIDVADIFTDITQIAKVEKGSSRSGRRVADDEEDLSMTEVPDKQSEGTGESRRGRGRGRSRSGEAVTATSGRSRRSTAAAEAPVAADGQLLALPGEKLSRVAAASNGSPAAEPDDEAVASEAPADADEGAESAEGGEAARRRRRRRGGRGRGRGRREEGFLEGAPDRPEVDVDEDEFEAPPPARRAANSTFGSVWDSQIGVPAQSGAAAASRPTEPFAEDDEDLDEPPIPEYLIAERRQRDAGRGRSGGGRGRGGAYAAAMDRERFGGGRGAQVSRFVESGPRRNGGGPNRLDRPDRDRGDRGGFRPEPRPAPRSGSSDEPWSEVPPEIEAMLRAQMGSGGRQGASRDADRAPRRAPSAAPRQSGEAIATAPASEPGESESTAPKRPARRTATRRPVASTAVADEAMPEGGDPESTPFEAPAKAKAPKAAAKAPARRASARTTKAAKAADAGTGAEAPGEPLAKPAAPKRRARKAAGTADTPA